jgi:hypothetical protein
VDKVADPHFVFNTDDLGNVFQLEAVAEFYANYNDPWRSVTATPAPGENQPLAPASVLGGAGNYLTVDLLDPEGDAAAPVPPTSGTTTTQFVLDGTVDLTRVWARDAGALASNSHRDLIYLEAATSRPGRWYKIMAINPTTRTVTLDAAPVLNRPTSAWRIRLRPRLVLVDPIGPRASLRGERAWLASSRPDERRLQVGPEANLATININFDTVYLPADTARTSKTYRIVGCDRAAGTVTLDAAPKLAARQTAWQMPAGLGGRFTPVATNFPSSDRGMDHYQGVMFVVYDGRVHTAKSWSSMTSVRWAPGAEDRSSVRGNAAKSGPHPDSREYDCVSWVSSEVWRSYSYSVVTRGAGDHVDEARFYFDNVANPPGTWAAPPESLTVRVDGNGKGTIRIHDGHTNTDGDIASGTGSAGCVVSPLVHEWRELMIDLHQQERALLGSPPDPQLTVIAGCNTRAAAQALWTNSHGATPPAMPDSGWVHKLAARLWVIRPEERPLV